MKKFSEEFDKNKNHDYRMSMICKKTEKVIDKNQSIARENFRMEDLITVVKC